MLSFYFSGGVIYNGDFGVEGGTIWMDEIKCSGEEASLDQCLFNGWGKSNCESTHDVAVSCDHKHEQGMCILSCDYKHEQGMCILSCDYKHEQGMCILSCDYKHEQGMCILSCDYKHEQGKCLCHLIINILQGMCFVM